MLLLAVGEWSSSIFSIYALVEGVEEILDLKKINVIANIPEAKFKMILSRPN